MAGVALVTVVYARVMGITNHTTVAMTLLLVVLLVAATSRFLAAAITSVAAMLSFNFFFIPPVGTLTIADPQNWVALAAFLTVSLVASNLSAAVQARAREAVNRRDALARLFDLSRDVMLMTDSREAVPALARAIARRFDLDYTAICLPRGKSWDVVEGGSCPVVPDFHQLDRAMAGASTEMEFDARGSSHGESLPAIDGQNRIGLVPLRLGTRPIGVLATGGRPVETGTRDALAGLAAIAIERAQFLEDRKSAELARQSEELKSALLASLGHDLRTPLTTIRVAASNLRGSWASEDDREVQSGLILAEVERLNRLFQNILDMAKLDAGAVSAERRWTHPAEVVEAARSQVEHIMKGRRVNVQTADDTLIKLDPQLTASALAHLLENAAQYSPSGSAIDVEAHAEAPGLRLSVRDRGPGIAPQDLPRLFDRFYRGGAGKHRTSGTGMGLSIARGLLAIEQGQVSAENCDDGGARFTMMVPGETRIADRTETVSV